MGRVDRERRQHREDLLFEHPLDVAAVVGVETAVVGEVHVLLLESLHHVGEDAHLHLDQRHHPVADLEQLLFAGHAIG